MARKSTIDQLPSEIREKIASLRQAGQSIDQILEVLTRLEVEVSRSALGRHTKTIDEAAAYLQRSRAMAEATMERIGNQGPSKVARLNVELLHGVLQELVIAASSDDALTLDAKAVKFLAEATEKLTKAGKTATDEEIRAAAMAKAASELEQKAGSLGLTAQTVKAIKDNVLFGD